MADQVMMDYDQVQKLSDALRDAGDTMQNVIKAIDATVAILKATAFIGNVGVAAVTTWDNVLRPLFDNAAKKLVELSKDVADAIKFIRDGNSSGSMRFC
jgi:uncharacterized protein YukE